VTDPATPSEATNDRISVRFMLLVAVLFFGFAGFGASLALLPSRIEDGLGRGDVALGVAAGVFSVAAIASRLLGGYVVDHFGARFGVALALVTAAIGGLLFLTPGLGGVIAARCVQGTADAILYVAVAAAALDMVPEQRRSQALGWLSGGLWAGLSAGAALTTFIDDLRPMGVIVAIAAVASLGIVALLPARVPSPAAIAASGPRWRSMLAPEAYRPGVVLGFTNLGYAAFTGFAVRFASDRFDHANLLLTAFAVTLLFARAGLGFLVDRMQARFALDVGHVLLAGGLLTVAFSQQFWMAITGAVIAAIGHSLPWPVIATSTLELAGPERRGAIIGTLSASFDAMVAVALFGFGVVSDQFGAAAVFFVAVGGVAVANALSRTIRSGRLARPAAPVVA
jgi:predicted MFS family arabinose efflux permease